MKSYPVVISQFTCDDLYVPIQSYVVEHLLSGRSDLLLATALAPTVDSVRPNASVIRTTTLNEDGELVPIGFPRW